MGRLEGAFSKTWWLFKIKVISEATTNIMMKVDMLLNSLFSFCIYSNNA
jgi:hypothetical protein